MVRECVECTSALWTSRPSATASSAILVSPLLSFLRLVESETAGFHSMALPFASVGCQWAGSFEAATDSHSLNAREPSVVAATMKSTCHVDGMGKSFSVHGRHGYQPQSVTQSHSLCV
jgi:hypothetical protein